MNDRTDDSEAPISGEDLLERMRSARVLAGPLPSLDPDPEQAPDAPGTLFASWLAFALDNAVPEPHVMTLSTADAEGRPSARVLMLRGIDVDDCAFVFASDVGSRKGRELAVNPYAALTWYWPRHGRQIRMTGTVRTVDSQTANRDFLERGEPSRASGFTGRMSASLPGPAVYDEERRRAAAFVAANPEAVPHRHTVYRLRADEAEFFQGDSTGRFHVRLSYVRQDGHDWSRGLLWP
jgi:pyridoxamine 5'-phosphate oxidase